LGLIPFIFSFSSHIIFTFTLVLIIWFSIISFILINNLNRFLVHLLPVSTPSLLCRFIVIIELVSQIIRPITLSVRLAANITAGHILLVLLRSIIVFINLKSLAFCLLVVLELAVVFIQSYVFCVLFTIYLLETN
jgi:ATP synthase subunit 6